MRKFVNVTLAAVLLFSMSLSQGVVGVLSPAAPARSAVVQAVAAPVVEAPEVPVATAPAAPQYAKANVIVDLKSAPTAAEKRAFAAAHGVSIKDLTQGESATQLSVAVPAGQTVDGLLDELAADPAVASADRNYIRHVTAYTAAPNDPDFNSASTWTSNGVAYPFGKSWWLRTTGVSALWTAYENAPADFPVRAGNEAFKIAVIDTGFYMSHPDRGANIVAGKDEFESYTGGRLVKDADVTPAPETAPENDRMTAAHGTCVAGEIAAATNNGAGVASAGFDNKVVVYKVAGVWTEGDPLNGWPAGSVVIFDQAIIDAIYSATNDGCKVINMSLGGPGLSTAMQTAINYAHNRGVVVIAATGNSGVTQNFYPAAAANVVGVGSYELNSAGSRIRSSFTNYGSQLDVLAPGKLVWGLTNPAYATGYEWWQGTSMASPAFAGMLAMVWRFAPALTNAEITNYMLTSATAAGTGQPNGDYGYGFVNVAGAYAKLKTDFSYLATPSVTTTKTAYASEAVNLAWAPVAGRNVSYRVARDGAAPATQTATTAAYTGLAEGTHTVNVTPVSSYNWTAASAATTYTFTVDKTAPVVSGITYAAGRIAWTDSEAGLAHTTAVRIDSAATQTVTGDSFDIAEGSLPAGTHTFRISETDAVGNTSAAVSFVFDFGTIAVPVDAPVPEAAVSVGGAKVSVSWGAVADASAYELELNDVADAATTAGLSAVVTGLVDGENRIRVRGLNSRGEAGPWSDAITVQRLITYTVEAGSGAAITYGSGAALAFSVKDAEGDAIADRPVVLQYSYDSVNWETLTTATTNASGAVGYDFSATRNAWVRPIVEGDAEYGSTTGDAVRVLVYPGLVKPVAPTTVTRKRSFTIYGYLTPKHTSGAHDVRIKIYRQKRAGGAFTYYKTVTATNHTVSSTKTKYSVKTTVAYAGAYRAYAYYRGTAKFSAMTSAYRQFKAK